MDKTRPFMPNTRAFVPFTFFDGLYPFNATLLQGNGMTIQACGAGPSGDIRRSRTYLLFGHGIVTLLPNARLPAELRRGNDRKGFVAEITEKRDPRGVEYWEFQCAPDQILGSPGWELKVFNSPPDPDMEGHVRILVEMPGVPGQYLFIACIA